MGCIVLCAIKLYTTQVRITNTHTPTTNFAVQIFLWSCDFAAKRLLNLTKFLDQNNTGYKKKLTTNTVGLNLKVRSRGGAEARPDE